MNRTLSVISQTPLVARTDSYKAGAHYDLYPKDTEHIYSYLTVRGANHGHTSVQFLGTRYLCRLLEGQVVTQDNINMMTHLMKEHMLTGGFNKTGWEYILNEHGGKLPIRIKAVPEGTIVPIKNVLLTIENTDPKVPWLTNYLESLILSCIWGPTTVGTRSYGIKQICAKYLEKTGDIANLPYMLNDFSVRGDFGNEVAMLGGAAHLVNFQGTDNIPALLFCRLNYDHPTAAGYSVVASEHSVMGAEGEEGEVNVVRRILEQNTNGIVSIVCDTYNTDNFITNILGKQLKNLVMSRNGKVVIRNDSGDPSSRIAANLRLAAEAFGVTENSKGYEILDSHVGLMQSDGIKDGKIDQILDMMHFTGWSADNIVFGMGGGLVQDCTRDTEDFSIKCSAIKRAGEWHNVFKNSANKKSIGGRMILRNTLSGGYETVVVDDPDKETGDLLQTIFLNGETLVTPTLTEIRERSWPLKVKDASTV